MPVTYSNSSSGGSGNVNIPEVYTDPVSPAAQSAWVLATQISTIGTPMGLLLSLTYAATTYSYQFSYKTIEGPIVRTVLS